MMDEKEQLELMKKYATLVGYLKGLRRALIINGSNVTANDITRQLDEVGEEP